MSEVRATLTPTMPISPRQKIVLNDIETRAQPLTRDGIALRITTEKVVHDLDPHELGKKPIAAIRDLVRQQIKAIAALASPATIARRARAAAAALKGHSTEARRYAGAAPDRSNQLFHDTGALADRLEVHDVGDGKWELRTGRVNEAEFTPTAIDRFWLRLQQLVPALRGEALEDPKVQRAILDAHKDAVYVTRNGRRVPR